MLIDAANPGRKLTLLIVVAIGRNAEFVHRGDEIRSERMNPARLGHADRSLLAVNRRSRQAAHTALHAPKDGQHGIVVPTAIAQLRPLIVVESVTAHIDGPVD